MKLEFTGRHTAYPTRWLPFPASEDILALFAHPRAVDPVASLGKVPGNCAMLYKYCNRVVKELKLEVVEDKGDRSTRNLTL